jgi:hypothetical protein
LEAEEEATALVEYLLMGRPSAEAPRGAHHCQSLHVLLDAFYRFNRDDG